MAGGMAFVACLVTLACGARTDPTLAAAVDSLIIDTPDGQVREPVCGPLPGTGLPGFYNATLCTNPGACDDVGGREICPCAGAVSPALCGFDAIHDDGHVFTAQCDRATGVCQCIIDSRRCACMGTAGALCGVGTSLNCCFSQ
jgi:hypothetical protein